MIHIYGDSHGRISFSGLDLSHQNHSCNSITMFRIGRDQSIINFHPSHLGADNILVFVYGEIDVRFHIGNQILHGRKEEEIIQQLVMAYFNTIKTVATSSYRHIIITSIVPPLQQEEHESLYGKITHEYPFQLSDAHRVRFRERMNSLLQQYCQENHFIFFDPYEFYTRPDGTLKFEYSDTNVHIQENSHVLQLFKELIENLS
jgi:hypothetical protein